MATSYKGLEGKVLPQFTSLTFRNQQRGMRVYVKLVMIMGLEYKTLPHQKEIWLSRVQCSHIATHKYTCSSPDRKTHAQIDYIINKKKRHSSTRDLQSFIGADCDTEHHVVAAEARQKLSVKFDMERFNSSKLGDVEVKEHYQAEISNRVSTLENLDDDDDDDDMGISRVWESTNCHLGFFPGF
jgi:hypothetical protein